MICTVTLNPTLDITYVVEDITPGVPLKALEVIETPGGKGINVSRALRNMGVGSVAVGLVGGYTGREVLARLRAEGLFMRAVEIENETRTNVVVLGRRDKKELVIRAAGPPVDAGESEKACRLVLELARGAEVLVLSGSVPPGMPEGVYYSLVQGAKAEGAKVVLDSEGEPLRLGVEAGPFLVKPNLEELCSLAGGPVRSESEILKIGCSLLGLGISVVVVSMGPEGAVMMTREGAWRGRVPAVEEDTVGAGDSMVAGLVMGMIGGLSNEGMLRLGLSCGLSAVLNKGPGLCEPESQERAHKEVTIQRIS